MTDRIPGTPGRYSASLPNGELVKMQNGEPFAITLIRDDDPIVEGTPYSKASVLPDELAQKLCPGVADPAPKDALAALHLIVEQGSYGKWNYRKWENGTAECWGLITLEYMDSRSLARWVELPFNMSGMVCSMIVVNAGSDYKMQVANVLSYSTVTTNNRTMRFWLIKDSGGLESTDYAQVAVHITGSWK